MLQIILYIPYFDNMLLKIAPDPNYLLFFINAVDVYLVNTFLNGRPYHIVNCVERYLLLGAMYNDAYRYYAIIYVCVCIYNI